MTEVQTWAALGILAVALVGMITLVTTLLGRTITAQFTGLRGEMNARFDAVDVRFAAMNDRIDNLDRDVQGIAHKVFGKDF